MKRARLDASAAMRVAVRHAVAGTFNVQRSTFNAQGRATIGGALNILGAALLAIALGVAIVQVCRLHVEMDGPAPLTMREYEERLLRGEVWPDEVCEMCGAVGAEMEGQP